jgi:hypothetical protein
MLFYACSREQQDLHIQPDPPQSGAIQKFVPMRTVICIGGTELQSDI